jgi:hypothetical protein
LFFTAEAQRGKPPLRISDFGLRIVKYGGLFLAATRSVAPTSNDPDMILNLLRKLNICNTEGAEMGAW